MSTQPTQAEVGDDYCHHLPEYRVDGECLRCSQAWNTAEERAVERELVRDSWGLR